MATWTNVSMHLCTFAKARAHSGSIFILTIKSLLMETWKCSKGKKITFMSYI